MKIEWITTAGKHIKTNMTLREAMARSAYLEKQEQDCVKYAPTDSGMVRMDNLLENIAIIFAIKKGEWKKNERVQNGRVVDVTEDFDASF